MAALKLAASVTVAFMMAVLIFPMAMSRFPPLILKIPLRLDAFGLCKRYYHVVSQGRYLRMFCREFPELMEKPKMINWRNSSAVAILPWSTSEDVDVCTRFLSALEYICIPLFHFYQDP